jgi:hypothetical protein
MWIGTERRSDLKEEASHSKQSEVAAKDTREREREIAIKWNFHYLELQQPTLDDHKRLVFIPPS